MSEERTIGGVGIVWRLTLILALVGVAFALYSVAQELRHNSGGETACTLEAKICSDGSAVGRTGPQCEFAACPGEGGTAGGGILLYQSGVRGSVLLGPVCPVERFPPEPQCAPRPYETTVLISRVESQTTVYVTVQSGADGTFEAALPPGDYLVTARGGEVFPTCGLTGITVPPEGYVGATVECDTGIR